MEENMKAYTEVKMEEDIKVGQININNMVDEVKIYHEVKITIKYVPNALSPNTNPSYNILSVYINEKYIEESLG